MFAAITPQPGYLEAAGLLPRDVAGLAVPHAVFCTQSPGNKLALERVQCSGALVL